MKVVVVGAGISGLTAAVLLREKGHEVEVFETMDHLGGHCHDSVWQGVLVQQFGPHIFHTNDLACWNFVSRYTEFYNFYHLVVADTDFGQFNIPLNFFSRKWLGRDLSDEELLDAVYRGYSEKMWGMRWDDLPGHITKRVPPRRSSFDCRYTMDMYHGVPRAGYHAMFNAMSEGINVHLGAAPNDWRKAKGDLLVYTGKLDEYFGFRHGILGYRSIRFEHRGESRRAFPIINECRRSVPWTRSTDHSHWVEQDNKSHTIVTYEYPCDHDGTNEPFYPKPWGEHAERAERYRAAAKAESNVVFFGRLATYTYLDMNMAVEQAIREFK